MRLRMTSFQGRPGGSSGAIAPDPFPSPCLVWTVGNKYPQICETTDDTSGQEVIWSTVESWVPLQDIPRPRF